jgi:hypothetical protein
LNIISDYTERRGLDFHLSLSRVGRLCEYRNGIGCPASLDLNKRFHDIIIGEGLIFKEMEGKDSDLDLLRAVTEDDNKSLPIVAVHPDYFSEMGVETRGTNEDYRIDHVVIIFAVNSEVIFLYDPYEGFLKARHGYDTYAEVLNIPRFLALWSRASISKWMAWIEPIQAHRIDKDWEAQK